MAVKWTPEQRKVIELRNRNILVSAAAGSGKTAVLVERIIQMLTNPERPVDVDRLLVVTFTRAAAGEMRERVLAAIEKRLEAEPENEHLQRQQTLIYNAQITTIDSFCSDVLRSYFHLIGLDPDCRVADEGEQKLLRGDVMEEMLEAHFQENSRAFAAFVEAYAPGRDDRRLGEYIERLYEFSMSHPWPEQWLDSCLAPYEAESVKEMLKSSWAKEMFAGIKKILGDFMEIIREAKRICMEPEGPWMYAEALESDAAFCEKLLNCKTYSEMSEQFRNRSGWARLSAKKDASVSQEKKAQVKELRDQGKKLADDLEKQYFYGRPEELYEDMKGSRQAVETLVSLAKEFGQRYREAKEKKNIMDFHDMEHLALKILVEQKNGEALPTQAAKELSGRYDEIMIDEYQDSNQVQELILTSVSKAWQGENNRFMVGDVKQSIYRFRMARPELFMEKYNTYSQEDGPRQRIDLHKNFRSRTQVLDSANGLFRKIMTEKLGGVVYDEAAALYPGASYPETDGMESEVLLLDLDADRTAAEESMETDRELEARMVGERILELVGKTEVLDKETGKLRKAKFGDCVILLRTVAGWAEPFLKILGNMGIPAYTGTRTGYFSSVEIQTVIALLKIIDNPRQDIALAAVLASPIGGFSSKELAIIRSGHREGDLFGACAGFLRDCPDTAETGKIQKRLSAFFTMLDGFRQESKSLPMHELLWKILDETGYGDYAAAMPGGSRRAANIRLLEEKAAAYEATSYRGLYNFVRYLENLKKAEVDYGEAAGFGEEEDMVKIMSIHKSKGLEFPIVFVSGLQKSFNRQDIRSRLVLHPDLGLGCDFTDPKLRVRTPLLIKKVLQKKVDEDNLAEELRVLYVALTRPKEKLILTAAVSKLEKRMAAWRQTAALGREELPYTALAGAGSFLDWLMPALMSGPDGKALWSAYAAAVGEQEEPSRKEKVSDALPGNFRFYFETPGGLVMEETKAQLDLTAAAGRLWTEEASGETIRFQNLFSARYPYEENRKIPGKMTVSQLKRASLADEEEPALRLYEEPQETEPAGDFVPLIPPFMQTEQVRTGAARGILYHQLLKELDFTKTRTLAQIESQRERLWQRGFLTQEESRSIRLEHILHFAASPLGQRMRRAYEAGCLYREQQFVLGVEAREIKKEWDDGSQVLVQGIIDAYFREGDGLVLVDYKTDYTADKSGGELLKKYGVQLQYYKKALERLTHLPVTEMVIYSFWLEKTLWV